MYRAQEESPAARFEQARARHAAVLGSIQAKRADLARLMAEVHTRGGSFVPIPEPPSAQVAAVDPATLPPAAMAAVAEQLERAAGALESYRAQLDATEASLRARLSGASVHATLGPAPRPVPAGYLVAEWLSLPFILVLAIGGSLVFVAGSIVPQLRFLPAAFVVVVLAWSAWATSRRTGLLARGGVPVSTTVSVKPGIGSYTNTRMNQFVGWDLQATNYTGPSYVSRVTFVAGDGATGEVVVRGMKYGNGMILCQGGRGLMVERFHSRPRPDDRGQWSGELAGAQKIAIGIGAALLLGSLAGAAVLPIVGEEASAAPHKAAASHRGNGR